MEGKSLMEGMWGEDGKFEKGDILTFIYCKFQHRYFTEYNS